MKLILFFNGWGIPKSIFDRLNNNKNNNLDKKYEIKIIDLEESILNVDFDKYSEINVIAWSFGIYNACKQLNDLDTNKKNILKNKINKKIAINGTVKSIDRKYGISPIIFKNTLESMNPSNYLGFLENTGLEIENNYIENLDINKYTEILRTFGEKYLDNSSDLDFSFKFDNFIISKGDKIFTARNQLRFSKDNNINEKTIVGEHYCFDRWDNWGEILDEF